MPGPGWEGVRWGRAFHLRCCWPRPSSWEFPWRAAFWQFLRLCTEFRNLLQNCHFLLEIGWCLALCLRLSFHGTPHSPLTWPQAGAISSLCGGSFLVRLTSSQDTVSLLRNPPRAEACGTWSQSHLQAASISCVLRGREHGAGPLIPTRGKEGQRQGGKTKEGRNGISVGHVMNTLGQKDLKSLSTYCPPSCLWVVNSWAG